MLVRTEKSWDRLPELATDKKANKTDSDSLKPAGLFFVCFVLFCFLNFFLKYFLLIFFIIFYFF